jgi:hypothetical protein
MKKEIKGIIYVLMILLQFYVGVTLLTTPEDSNWTHFMVVIFISIPVILTSAKDANDI